jgi:23S rRNA (pseudouridine1915-N3)-methyltransferase
MKMTIVAIGKVKKTWIREGIGQYHQRLPDLEIIELKDSNPQKEAAEIRAYLHKTKTNPSQMVSLSEEGQLKSSVELAQWLDRYRSASPVFVIGGPDGLDGSIKTFGGQCFSLSPLTFPHELARLLLVEQLYRAQTIRQNSRYHR